MSSGRGRARTCWINAACPLLVTWIRDNGLTADRWDEPAGDCFACRYEAYLTDPRSQPMKTKWQVELNIRLADEA